jgi:DNA primase
VSTFVSLQKRGKNFAGLCPFHQEKTPSFFVSPEKNICKCYGCGEGGTPINFLKKIKNISFEEAATELAEKAGIEVQTKKVKKDPYENYYTMLNEVASFYEFNLKHSEKGIEALNYLSNRQLADAEITHFRLGLAPSFGNTIYQLLKNKGYQVSDMIKCGIVKQNDQGEYYDLFADRIIFPITDPKGRVVGFSGRTMNPKETVKYMNSPETIIFKKGLLLYHFYEALPEIRKEKQIILYEGFFDVISSYAAGMKHGVATMGTALTKEQARLMKSMSSSVLIAYDGDSAGLKASDHAIPILEKEGLKVEVLTIPEKMDPDDFIKSYGPEAYEKLFGEFTEDAYQFRYRYYRLGKNLANANDLKAYKKAVMSMIQFSDPSIRAYYIQKFSQEFNIPLSELEMGRSRAPIEPPKLPPQEQTRMLNRHEKAERYLIFAMLKSRKHAMLVQEMLKATDYADVVTASIRLQIEHYYEDHMEMDLQAFTDSLNQEQRDLMINDLLKETFYIMNMEFTDVDIEEFIQVVYSANYQRKLDELKHRMSHYTEPPKELMEEYNQLLRMKKQNKKPTI